EAVFGRFFVAPRPSSGSIPSERSTCRHGRNAAAPSASTHRPHVTDTPFASATPASSRAIRVFPAPGFALAEDEAAGTAARGLQRGMESFELTAPSYERAGFRDTVNAKRLTSIRTHYGG